MKNNALLFKWSGKMVLTNSLGLIVCFDYFEPTLGQFRPNLGPKWPNMTPSNFFVIFMDKLNSEDETIWKSWSLVLFIFIWPSWTYFGPILGHFWITYGPNLGFNTQYMNFYMKKNALLFNWSRKMVLTDSVDQIMCFWLFLANFGPILVQFRSKMAKYDPVKPVSKIFM